MSQRDFMNVDETARFLQVSTQTLLNWRKRNHGPPYVKLSSKLIRYRRTDVHEWFNAQYNGAA